MLDIDNSFVIHPRFTTTTRVRHCFRTTITFFSRQEQWRHLSKSALAEENPFLTSGGQMLDVRNRNFIMIMTQQIVGKIFFYSPPQFEFQCFHCNSSCCNSVAGEEIVLLSLAVLVNV